MSVDEIGPDRGYTHIHFAFANVTRGEYKVEITDPKVLEQFELFKGMTGVKKIISLGGWAFSTEPGTFQILREAAQPVREFPSTKCLRDTNLLRSSTFSPTAISSRTTSSLS
jgi:GH18 family chitinase